MQSTLTAQTDPLAGLALAATEAATIRRPPPLARSRRLSGRPSCRIYLGRDLGRGAWILEFDSVCGGWMEPSNSSRRVEPKTLAFPTLAAAVGYAERRGYDYRILPPAAHSVTSVRRRRETLLSSNARNGGLYDS
jgi:hypothetical protein